jgi:hypothetical protein
MILGRAQSKDLPEQLATDIRNQVRDRLLWQVLVRWVRVRQRDRDRIVFKDRQVRELPAQKRLKEQQARDIRDLPEDRDRMLFKDRQARDIRDYPEDRDQKAVKDRQVRQECALQAIWVKDL